MKIPVLLFLVFFLLSLVNSTRGIFLVILVFSESFPRILWFRQGQKILGNFEVVLDRKKTRNQGNEGQGLYQAIRIATHDLSRALLPAHRFCCCPLSLYRSLAQLLIGCIPRGVMRQHTLLRRLLEGSLKEKACDPQKVKKEFFWRVSFDSGDSFLTRFGGLARTWALPWRLPQRIFLHLCPVTAWVKGGLLTRWPGVKYVLCAQPEEHKHVRPGTRPGGSVTGVAEKLLMCQMLVCLFWPLMEGSFKGS